MSKKAPAIYSVTVAGFAIELHRSQRNRDRYDVRYGAEKTLGLSYSEAARELGYALLHALTCEGKLDAPPDAP